MKTYDETMLSLTADFIKKYQQENDKSPSLREISKAFPRFYCNLPAKVRRYLCELDRRGIIEYSSGVQIPLKLSSGKTKAVSLVGACPCGSPMLAVENIEGTYSLPVDIFGSEQHFILRAVGHSMINAGIDDGDLMIVRQQNFASPKQIVIALIDESATAKVFIPKKDKIILRACNDSVDADGNRTYPDIVVESCEILGVVDKVIHTPTVR